MDPSWCQSSVWGDLRFTSSCDLTRRILRCANRRRTMCPMEDLTTQLTRCRSQVQRLAQWTFPGARTDTRFGSHRILCRIRPCPPTRSAHRGVPLSPPWGRRNRPYRRQMGGPTWRRECLDLEAQQVAVSHLRPEAIPHHPPRLAGTQRRSTDSCQTSSTHQRQTACAPFAMTASEASF